MASPQFYVMRKAEVDLLRQLLTNLKDAIPHLKGMDVDFFPLADASGNSRLLKLLAADKEDGEPGSQGGGGLPADYTFEEFTICVDGAPETRWWPTWTSDPS